MSNPDHTSPEDDAVRGGFPRIELPPVPSLGRTSGGTVPVAAPGSPAPAISLDGRPVGGQDESPAGWQYPYAATSTAGYTYHVPPPPMPGPVPAGSAATSAPELAHGPGTESAPYVMPHVAPVSDRDAASDEADDADTGPSTVVLVLFAVVAVALLWASRMAFSAGLLAFASLLIAELSLATSFARRAGASRPASSTLAAIAAVAVALNAARHAFAQFGETAFVAGLFVLVAGVPSLLAVAVATLLLRRSSASSRANDALRSWTAVRLAALAALLVAGFQAHRTFSAKPDAIVALGIVALALLTAVAVLRGTGRAARSAAASTR